MLLCLNTWAQNITILPYLQDAHPTSIYIMWETDADEESIVEWGFDDQLGNETIGVAYTSEGTNLVHEVQLENLEPFTHYHYRVRTGNAVSSIYGFKTPPLPSADEDVRIVAMSDMQQDGAFPNKFEEIVEDGVIDYLQDEFGGELIDNLALVMIPGDLVTNGNSFGQWKNTFFNPGEELFSHVPVYPVLGNHEVNTDYYFTYFKMPENGTAGFEEHWWHKDYGNVRIIGLDSNAPFDNPEQLEWLGEVLDETCAAESVDFVFAQLHHPHKSELWTPGESDFTGEVIELLENFTTDCGKPSIHFFGHTHGYSRGQSRDHKHLWINVATAGGAIDNWGEFPNFDYDEFSVSQDEYGFVVVDIVNDDDPRVVIKRVSRGDQDAIIDNEVTDSLVVRLSNFEVSTPTPQFPVSLSIPPECVILEADAFASSNPGSEHGQSHWQVASSSDGFDEPVFESWKNFENWYYDVDTQAEDDLTDELVPGLEELSTYWWRVRYRDKEMNWSDWCEPASFSTDESVLSPNLILNPGAEDDLSNWSIAEGVVEALESEVCAGIAPHSGVKYFAVGGLCDHSEVGRLVQDVDVSAYSDSIDIETYSVNFGGYLSNYGGSDLPEMKIIFLDEGGIELGESDVLSTLNSTWTLFMDWETIPALTRTIRLELKGTRFAGTDNDSYFDDVFLKVGPEFVDCDVVNSVSSLPREVRILNISPNPATALAKISLPGADMRDFTLHMIQLDGKKINPHVHTYADVIDLERHGIPAGTYVLWLRDRSGIVATGKLILE